LTTGENVGKLKAEREADMAIIEFEGFDAKTKKALKKKVAEVVAKKPAPKKKAKKS
jgi:hypothetical protein